MILELEGLAVFHNRPHDMIGNLGFNFEDDLDFRVQKSCKVLDDRYLQRLDVRQLADRASEKGW
mgnify:CR=1 FL=1